MEHARNTEPEHDFIFSIVKILFLALFTFLVYSNTLHNQFVFDDSRIYLNPHIRLTTLDFQGLSNAWLNSEPKTRPVANTSFALNYFFHQDKVLGYHLVNISIHVITGIFLFLLLTTTIHLPTFSSGKQRLEWLPFLSVLLWLVHPVQTQSVTYTIQRMNSLAAMFYVIALFSYVQGRLAVKWRSRAIFFGGAVGAGLLALGSKELAWVLPIFIVLYDWYFIQDLDCTWLKKYTLPFSAIIILLVMTSFYFYYGKNPFTSLMLSYTGRDFTLIERLLTESRVVIFYLSILFFPSPDRLNLDHDFALSRSLLTPSSTLLSLVTLALIFGIAVMMARRHRLLSFGIIWFLGNLFIESSLIPLEIVFEHRLYLPSTMLIVALLAAVLEYLPNRRANLSMAVVLVILLSVWTFQRNQIWADPLSLWSDCVKKSPQKARGHSNLAVALKKKGQLDAAEFHFQKTIEIDPTFFEAYYNLGNIMILRGKSDRAIAYYRKSIAIKPNHPVLHVGLGNALMNKWQLEEARAEYKKALAIQPGNRDAKTNFLRVNRMIQSLPKPAG